jgi:hypothetical protein
VAKSGTKTPRRNPRENPQETPQETEGAEDSFSPLEGSGLFSDVSRKEDDYVRVLRRDDAEKTLVFHGKLAPEETTSEKIAELFGGGYYKCIYFQRSETGAYVFTRARIIRLPGPYKPPTGQLPGVGQPNPASSNGKPEVGTLPQGGSATETLNSALVASVLEMMKSFSKPAPPPPPPLPWGEILTAISPIVKGLLERKPEPQPDVMEIVKQVKELLPASNPAAPVTNTVTDMIKGMKELLGLKDVLEGKEGPVDSETAMWTLGAKALDVLAARGGATQPETQPQQPGRTAPPQLPPDTPMWKRLLLSQKKQLLNAAGANIAPDTAAELALQFLPPTAQGVLAEFLALPDHVEIAMQTIPELRNFPHWTQDFFAEVVLQFSGEEERMPTLPPAKLAPKDRVLAVNVTGQLFAARLLGAFLRGQEIAAEQVEAELASASSLAKLLIRAVDRHLSPRERTIAKEGRKQSN